MFVETVGVVGAGTMGAQLAELFALNGKRVILRDIKEEFVQKGLGAVRASLDGLAQYHEERVPTEIARAERQLGVQLTPDQGEQVRKKFRPTFTKARVDEAFGRIQPTTELSDLAKSDFVIEAIVEDLDAKNQLFQHLNRVADPRAIFASNTSALPITRMAEASGRPKRFVGAHFFNPPVTLPLVEIIPGKHTDPETVDDVVNLISTVRNHRYPMLPIVVKECPGFLVNRILGAMLEETYKCLEEGIASARDIDTAMKAGAGLPMGPLELSDHIGLDVIQHVRDHVARLAKDYPFAQNPTIINRLVEEGRLGKKSGKGFFDY